MVSGLATQMALGYDGSDVYATSGQSCAGLQLLPAAGHAAASDLLFGLGSTVPQSEGLTPVCSPRLFSKHLLCV